VLSHPEVRRHLTTGLTTGLVLALAGKAPGGRRLRGAALVDVRWEPWDEVFLVTIVGADGRPRRERVGSMERLEALWAALELPMALGVPETPWQLELELSVVPFSQSEQRDAQRWFSGALAPESAGEPPRASGGAAQPNGVVDLLIATSIQRRSIMRFEWPLRPRPKPP
jgi:hypothetical protein